MLHQLKAYQGVAFLFAAGFAFGQNVPALFDRPSGLVPSEHTAVAIAERRSLPDLR
jgi:hypothetical protein